MRVIIFLVSLCPRKGDNFDRIEDEEMWKADCPSDGDCIGDFSFSIELLDVESPFGRDDLFQPSTLLCPA